MVRSLTSKTERPADSAPPTEPAASLTGEQAEQVQRLIEKALKQQLKRSELIGFTELCARTPLSGRTLRTLIQQKKIPAIRLPGGRKFLFDPEAVFTSLKRFERGGIEN